jgi:hypothetical protein
MELAALLARGVVTQHAAGYVAEPDARQRTLPVLPALEHLLPQGALQRGSVVACDGTAAVSMALALAAGPSHDGAWVGFAGMPFLGLAAAAELGVALERVVAVVEPSTAEGAPAPFTDAQWADLVAALIDGFDVVVLGPALQRLRATTVRRLHARLQSRGAVALTVGAPAFGADLRLQADQPVWTGLGQGHGVAQGRVVQVCCSGRRMPRAQQASLWLPTTDGQVCAIDDAPAMLAPLLQPLQPTG